MQRRFNEGYHNAKLEEKGEGARKSENDGFNSPMSAIQEDTDAHLRGP